MRRDASLAAAGLPSDTGELGSAARLRHWASGTRLVLELADGMLRRAISEGDIVEWNLAGDADDEWLVDVVGDEIASLVTHHEDHHDLEEGARTYRGRVLGIRCAYSRYAPIPGGDKRNLYPVAGTAEIVPVLRVDGREGLGSDLNFNGYLVELEMPHGN